MTPDIFTTKVVGVSFCESYPQSVFRMATKFAVGPLPLSLERDKNNLYDSNAIRVKFDGEMLGHLPALIARVVAKELDSGIDWRAEVDSILVSAEQPNQPGLKIRVWRQNETE